MSSAQDVGDSTRLLEAPSPLVLMVVIISSWWWRQWRETSIALRAVLAQLVPLGALTRLVLPAVLMMPVAPLLAGAAIVPSPSASSSSSAVAPVGCAWGVY